MTDAPSACAYVRESGRGRERAEPRLPSPLFPSEARSLQPPAFLQPHLHPLLAFPFSPLLSGLCWEGAARGSG